MAGAGVWLLWVAGAGLVFRVGSGDFHAGTDRFCRIE